MQKPKLVYTTYIRTTPKKAWDAITKPEFTRQYWGGMANVSDWKKGSKWEHVKKGETDEVWVMGKVLESTPPKRLSFSWADPDAPAAKSRVTFEITPIDDLVCLVVTHDQLKAGSKMLRNVSWGWPRVISSMKSYLETGTGIDVFCGCSANEKCD